MKKKTQKLPSTDIVFIVDMSGSMQHLKEDTIGGYNSFIEEQKKVEGECFVSLIMFDNVIEKPYIHVPLQDVPELTGQVYKPRGSTALLDAIGITINECESLEKQPDRFLVVIMTDGEENASREFTNESIKKIIETSRESKRYEFIFLGANIDSFSTARSFGMSMDNSMNYISSSEGTRGVMGTAGLASSMYRRSAKNFDNSKVLKSAIAKEKEDKESK